MVDLPDPDSPISVTVSPDGTVNETPSTARTISAPVISSTCRSSTSSSGLMPSLPRVRGRRGAIAQPVPEQVDPDHEQHDHEAGEGGDFSDQDVVT